uniref:Glycosyltransferase n=1 Tax=Streptomyces sp. MJ635-86F5 TaxID=1321967 RepID=X5IBU0_9ACTN|nr:glycosyltransferase [Streptomyces sp. MJ635-86F5]
MSAHILLVSLPDRGHIYPHVALAKELVHRGHRVGFVTAASMAELVASSGAAFIPYASAYEAVDDKVGTANDNNGAAMLDLGVDECDAMVRAAEEALSGDRPDLVAYDYATYQAGRLLEHKWGVPIVTLSPIFAQNETFSYAQAFAAGGYSDASPPMTMEEYLAHPAMAGWVAKNRQLLADHGLAHVPIADFLTIVRDDTIAYVPAELQPRRDSFDARFTFVGPCLSDRPGLPSWQPPGEDRPVVLVSLGTLFNEHVGFFKTSVDAFADSPFHVVMTLGNGIDPEQLGPLPDHVEVHRWVSHLDVLEHARAFVTLGGMSSVNDALALGCPLVVVPLSSVLERVTAHQVRKAGIGVELEARQPEELTPEMLRTAVETVIGDPAFGRNAARVREHVRRAGGTAAAADTLEARLARR